MRATFMNRLVFAEPEDQNTIRYVHQYRVDANIFIQKKKMGSRDWDVAIVPAKSMAYGAGATIAKELRQSLLNEFMVYVRRRMRQGVESVTFDDFISMTKATNIA